MKSFFPLCLSALLIISCTPAAAPESAQQSSANLSAQAHALLTANRHSEALGIFNQAIALDGRNISAYQGKGIILNQQGKHSEAEAVYHKALAIDKDAIGIINNLGLSYILRGEYQQAVRLLTPHTLTEPVHAKVIENLALAQCLSGNDAEARKLYRHRLKPKQIQENISFCQQFEQLRSRR